MSIDERNEALRVFKDEANIFISTDAGGEGLNLQFSNIIINYDLPWNPMKIEQRCGRADRIGQKRDVHIYNFTIRDTIENRVREVLEEKLSVILKEMGVDKYSDVLDSEVAEIDFTEAYMSSINNPSEINKNIYTVESEMKQQLINSKKYKDIIREEKDLTELVGQSSNFDIDSALRLMVMYYNAWKSIQTKFIDRISITNQEIIKHLKINIVHDKFSPILSVDIKNFPNEAGYFMLWELSLSDGDIDQRIIPIFINEDFVLRPMAGKRIMDIFLDPKSKLSVCRIPNITSDVYDKLEKMSMDFAYDMFLDLKEKQLQKNEENYNKYMYALQLRIEAAEHIGIKNIRESKFTKIQNEKQTIEQKYEIGKQIYPDFRLMIMVRLEV